MSETYRIFGNELSPYSVKVRAAFRYKGLPHEWVVRGRDNEGEFAAAARLPLVPLVIAPDGAARQDSTPILEWLDGLVPEPPLHPAEPTAAFVSALIEEYADEWVNKPMFHYRWSRVADRELCAERLARSMLPGAGDAELAAHAAALCERMVGRLHFVGSSPATAPVLEASYRQLLEILEAHLAGGRRFLFGARPVFADFGLAPQLYECGLDATAGALLRERAPRVLQWCERCLDPRPAGALELPLESWETLAPTLGPLLRDEIAGRFLPWSVANARALAAGESGCEVELAGCRFAVNVQKYHARSLTALQQRYRAAADGGALDSLLERSGCLRWLTATAS